MPPRFPRYDHCPTCQKPQRWRALYRGRVIETSYAPTAILEVQRLLRLGIPRDAIVTLTGVWYSSLNYVRELKPLLTLAQRAHLERHLAGQKETEHG